jgi:dolichol-phosphate mannosyltransferase
MQNSFLIFIPTFNEVENVEIILSKLQQLNISFDILFIDDNSPDGTGALLDRLAKEQTNLFVLHRSGKQGIGSAHRDGILWAYQQRYEKLLTMDCDLTHSPEYISKFINKSHEFEVVVGSRYLEKNSLAGWNLLRLFLTQFGHLSTKYCLGIPFDATGAFRLYNLKKIPQSFLNLVKSNGYSFFFESLFVLYRNQFQISEVATVLPARTYGHSKMRLRDALHSVKELMAILLGRMFGGKKYKLLDLTATPPLTQNASLYDPQNWDAYWNRENQEKTHYLYNCIAAFYRKFIITPNLNRFILKYFSATSLVLHAGCGSGQVDQQISTQRTIFALDISEKALFLYAKFNPQVKELIHGSIFNIPLPASSIDGIYNLGVMEHFTETEIHKALEEFNRILKPNGQIIIFWPHYLSLSVLALKCIHFFLDIFSREKIRLHPPEITYMHSATQAKKILLQAGFELTHYSFNITDAFTQAVLVGRKLAENRMSVIH